MFMGEYNHNIDSKGRLIIPSKFREQINDDLIISKGLDGCLFIYPKLEWNKIIDKYKLLPDTKNKRQFMRIFLSSASYLEFDQSGRINIPNSLITYSKLNKECVIIGVDERIEIWSKENWEDFVIKNECNLSEIAEDLFKINYYG